MADQTITPTFCRICEAGCGLLATTEGDRVVRLDPDKDHVASQGFACVKGLKFANLHHSPDRLDHPMKRVGDRWEQISWDQALAEIGAKVRSLRDEHGADAIAGYLGNPAAFGSFHAVAFNAFLEGLGTTQSYSSASQDLTNKYLVAKRLYGHELLQPIPDLDRTDLVVLIGTNPAISQMSVVQVPRAMARLKAIVDRGGRVVSVNPRRTETARAVGDHLFIRPGTDVFLLASFLHVVLAEDAVDHALVDAHTTGFEALDGVVADWSPERTEAMTGIPAVDLRALVADYLAADGASLYCSTGLNMGPHGTLAYWLLNVINAVTGNLDHAGGALVRTPPFDFQKRSKATGLGVSDARSRIGDFEAILGTFPASLLADEVTTPGPGQVKALFVSAGNPVLSVGNGDRLAAALDELELLVCIDLFRNETAEHAHYVLPACSWLERPDVPFVHAFAGLQVDPWLQYTEAVVPPAAERREESWIFARLADACGVGLGQGAAGFLTRGPRTPARGPAARWSLRGVRRPPPLARARGRPPPGAHPAPPPPTASACPTWPAASSSASGSSPMTARCTWRRRTSWLRPPASRPTSRPNAPTSGCASSPGASATATTPGPTTPSPSSAATAPPTASTSPWRTPSPPASPTVAGRGCAPRPARSRWRSP